MAFRHENPKCDKNPLHTVVPPCDGVGQGGGGNGTVVPSTPDLPKPAGNLVKET